MLSVKYYILVLHEYLSVYYVKGVYHVYCGWNCIFLFGNSRNLRMLLEIILNRSLLGCP